MNRGRGITLPHGGHRSDSHIQMRMAQMEQIKRERKLPPGELEARKAKLRKKLKAVR